MSSAAAELEASAQRERELRKIVLAWLKKKGYTRAEEQFRREADIAGNHHPLSPIPRARDGDADAQWRRFLPQSQCDRPHPSFPHSSAMLSGQRVYLMIIITEGMST